MTQTHRSRVLLVDDQPLLRMGFRLILEGEDDLRIVGEASDGAEAVRQVRELEARRRADGRPDARAGRHRGNPRHHRLRARGADHHPDHLDLDEYAFAGLQAGASAFLLKDVAPSELVSAVRVVASGDAVVAPARYPAAAGNLRPRCGSHAPAAAAATHARRDPLLEDLTPARNRNARGDGRGPVQRRDRAPVLPVGGHVKTHVRRILTKLHLRDRVQAVVYAYETGLGGPQQPGLLTLAQVPPGAPDAQLPHRITLCGP